MKARFALQGLDRIVVQLEPEGREEAYLLIAFMRFDSNVFSAYVERAENSQIERMTLVAGDPA